MSKIPPRNIIVGLHSTQSQKNYQQSSNNPEPDSKGCLVFCAFILGILAIQELINEGIVEYIPYALVIFLFFVIIAYIKDKVQKNLQSRIRHQNNASSEEEKIVSINEQEDDQNISPTARLYEEQQKKVDIKLLDNYCEPTIYQTQGTHEDKHNKAISRLSEEEWSDIEKFYTTNVQDDLLTRSLDKYVSDTEKE